MLDNYLNLIPIAASRAVGAPARVLLLRDGDIGWADLDGVELDAGTAQRIIARFAEQGVDLPIDYHHATTDVEDGTRTKAPAAGWIKRLEYVPGEGLYGHVEWTAQAKQEIESKQYKYLSPVILSEPGSKAITELHSVALTNRPRTIEAPELLEAAERAAKKGKPMDALTKLRAEVATLCKGLRLKAQPDGEVGIPAITDDTKAIADLITALNGAGVSIDATAPLVDVLTAAVTFISENAPEGEGEETEGEAEGTTETTTETSVESAEVVLKLKQYDRLVGEVKELRDRLDREAGDKAKAHVEKMIAGVIERNQLNPNDEEAMKAARILAEKDPAAFEKLFASAPSYAPAHRHGGHAAGTARAVLIQKASREYRSNPKIAFGAGERHYIDAVLNGESLPLLSDTEITTLKGGA